MKEPAQEWQASAVRQVEADPHAIHRLFPQAGRRGGPDARRALLGALRGDPAVIRSLYEAGDSGERLAILTVLHELDLDGTAVALVEDALRTNDARLVAAALGPYGSAWLGDHSFRQGVLKCVFMSIPLDEVAGLDRRFDAELARMLSDYAAELRAAGRPVPRDVLERI
ncbi:MULTISPECIES: EboA domain-containing protein [Nonomuraea]|uniref:EboA domain-containing protein n=1 Tax=Nonomuraea ferruginea TaxID=46174 RepID=A0ABT4T005_9ACTN|nr:MULTISPECIES: EboA domain-containing protein [Nonomuraea]MDA0642685.1 EboA domain-containing protein [Nonomuraea ferruginea]TXK41428.1 sugar phosphate isomerase [Nonomuraea sp. C10]